MRSSPRPNPSDGARRATPRPDRNPLYAAADPPASGRCPTARGPSVRPRSTLHDGLRTPGKNRDLHFLRTHAAVGSAMTEGLSVHLHDARGAIAPEHREDLSDPLSRDIGFAAAEEAGRDRLLAIQKEEGLRIAALEVLLDAIGLVRVKECETRLSGDRVSKERPELLVAHEVDELVRIGKGMTVIGGKQDERVARRSRRD